MIKTQRFGLNITTFHFLDMFNLLYIGLLNVEIVTSAMPINSATAEKVRLS